MPFCGQHFVDDFPNVRALADYLIYLDTHPDEYDKYLSWKRDGWSKDFKALVDLAHGIVDHFVLMC